MRHRAPPRLCRGYRRPRIRDRASTSLAAALAKLHLPLFGELQVGMQPSRPGAWPTHPLQRVDLRGAVGERGRRTDFRGRKAFIEEEAELHMGSDFWEKPSNRLLCGAAHAHRLPTPAPG